MQVVSSTGVISCMSKDLPTGVIPSEAWDLPTSVIQSEAWDLPTSVIQSEAWDLLLHFLARTAEADSSYLGMTHFFSTSR